MDCPICLGTIDVAFVSLNCRCKNTVYHITCINDWFKINIKCPMCNLQFRQTRFSKIKRQSENTEESTYNITRALFYDSINQFSRFTYKD